MIVWLQREKNGMLVGILWVEAHFYCGIYNDNFMAISFFFFHSILIWKIDAGRTSYNTIVCMKNWNQWNQNLVWTNPASAI